MGDKDIDRLSLFDALAGGYDTWFETRIGAFVHRRQLAMLGRLVGPRAGERLLEVGSGTGHFLREFARSGARCVGIEPSEEMLSVARASPMEGVQYLRGEGEHMPLADGIFDCVAYITTLEWVADVEACVSEAVRICVPGGRLVFLVLNARGPWYRQRVAEGGLWAEARFFDEATLRQLLSPYGTVTVEYAVHVPPSWARLPPVVIGVGDAAFRRLDRSDGALLGVRVDLRR